METLIIQTSPFCSTIYLRDAMGNTLGSFDSIEAAAGWCRDNNYRWRVQ